VVETHNLREYKKQLKAKGEKKRSAVQLCAGAQAVISHADDLRPRWEPPFEQGRRHGGALGGLEPSPRRGGFAPRRGI